MQQEQLKSIAYGIKKIAEKVRKYLGCGFQETIYQNALAIEFRKNNIEYLKEVNIEIFYIDESVGVDRPDFIITRIGNFTKPILLEVKVSDGITKDHKRQLKAYCISLPHNSNPALKDFAGGILLAFPKGEIEQGDIADTTIFCTDSKFNVIIDEQSERETREQEEKETRKVKKEL